jgi:hypothetical protein
MKRYERAVLKRAVKLIGAHVEPTALIGGRVFVLARRHLILPVSTCRSTMADPEGRGHRAHGGVPGEGSGAL